ncbi:SMI1/KNR4 family protein [Alkalihalobacterium sp. APHAB7]|uniref:SMI1/KNR4 family protein n=1 Tax=Alkalihalobacterium sp. APHAB7 TaxID=3402081 RepID=UPI003AAC5266
MKNVQWKYSKGEVNEATIAELESFYQVTFPEFYKKIIRKYNGARPRPCIIHIKQGIDIELRSFLPIGKSLPDNLVTINKALQVSLPKGVIAFANDDFGNYFCFDFRKKDRVVSSFFEHETSNLITISNEPFKSLSLSV